MRLLKILNTYIGVLGVIFIGAIVTLFLVFPRVVNDLAGLFGQMGDPLNTGQAVLHGLIALVIDLILAYFFVWRPVRHLRQTLDAPGLLVRRGEGNAYIDPDSVRQRILTAIAKVADIQHSDATVLNEGGRAVIRLNIVTGVEINGPKKKNEINREVRKIVQDQLGVEVAGKPTINFTLAGAEPRVPQLASSATSARSEPAMAKSVPPIPPAAPRGTTPPAPDDEDEVETVHARGDEHDSDLERPSGIELARRDALKYGSPAGSRPPLPSTPGEPPSGVAPSGDDTTAEPGGNSGEASADG